MNASGVSTMGSSSRRGISSPIGPLFLELSPSVAEGPGPLGSFAKGPGGVFFWTFDVTSTVAALGSLVSTSFAGLGAFGSFGPGGFTPFAPVSGAIDLVSTIQSPHRLRGLGICKRFPTEDANLMKRFSVRLVNDLQNKGEGHRGGVNTLPMPKSV